MSQTLTIDNPTGSGVAYISRDCRLTAPPGKSTHSVSDAAAKRLTDYLKSQHPLLKVTVKAAEPAPAADQASVDANKTSKAKPDSRRKTAPKASAPTDSEADTE